MSSFSYGRRTSSRNHPSTMAINANSQNKATASSPSPIPPIANSPAPAAFSTQPDNLLATSISDRIETLEATIATNNAALTSERDMHASMLESWNAERATFLVQMQALEHRILQQSTPAPSSTPTNATLSPQASFSLATTMTPATNATTTPQPKPPPTPGNIPPPTLTATQINRIKMTKARAQQLRHYHKTVLIVIDIDGDRAMFVLDYAYAIFRNHSPID